MCVREAIKDKSVGSRWELAFVSLNMQVLLIPTGLRVRGTYTRERRGKYQDRSSAVVSSEIVSNILNSTTRLVIMVLHLLQT